MGCSHPFENDQEEGEVLAAMCHSGETYSYIQVTREDDEYFK